MNSKTCCFTGHRQICNDDYINIKDALKSQIVKMIKNNVTNFICGGALGFDTIAAETILELKALYPSIKLIMILPCLNQTEKWKTKDIMKYNKILKLADSVKVLSQNYFNGCMHQRNRYMVDNSSYCVCYIRKNNGGTAYTLNYAVKKGLKIIYL